MSRRADGRTHPGNLTPTIWWATPLECQSAIQRQHRETPLAAAAITRATDRLSATHVSDASLTRDNTKLSGGDTAGTLSFPGETAYTANCTA
jgi:hypothetical protein